LKSLKLTLVTGRTVEQGVEGEHGKLRDEYAEKVAVIELDSEDLGRLGVSAGSPVLVKTAHGEVVLKAIAAKGRHPGIAFAPYSPWVNVVIDSETDGSGMPTYKGIEAEICPTEERVVSLEELIRKHYGLEVDLSKLAGQEVSGGEGGEEQLIKDVVCPFCGCLCDDVEVLVKGGVIVEVRKACAIGSAKFLDHRKERALHPLVRKDGEFVKVSLEEAIEEAAKILANSKYPLLYGWSSTSIEANELGIELAELLGGVIDNTTSVCHGPTVLGVQGVGTVRATLGQIRNRADLIIYWGSNPLNAHLRHLMRYSALARGVFIKGRKDRKVVVVDVRETPAAKMADLFIRVKPGQDYELISALRMAVRELDIEAKEVAGVPVEKIYELAEIMRTAKFGAVFFGVGVTMSPGKDETIENIIRLVQDLNEWTKFVLCPMRGHFNVTGACNVSLWMTGYAFGVDYMRKFPRHDPAIWTVTELLSNGDVDAALIVASDPLAHLPKEAAENLAKIPVVVVDPKFNVTATIAQVFIPSSFVGIEKEGSAYRMDGVSLRMKKVVDPPEGVLSDEEILSLLLEKVRELRGA